MHHTSIIIYLKCQTFVGQYIHMSNKINIHHLLWTWMRFLLQSSLGTEAMYTCMVIPQLQGWLYVGMLILGKCMSALQEGRLAFPAPSFGQFLHAPLVIVACESFVAHLYCGNWRGWRNDCHFLGKLPKVGIVLYCCAKVDLVYV